MTFSLCVHIPPHHYITFSVHLLICHQLSRDVTLRLSIFLPITTFFPSLPPHSFNLSLCQCLSMSRSFSLSLLIKLHPTFLQATDLLLSPPHAPFIPVLTAACPSVAEPFFSTPSLHIPSRRAVRSSCTSICQRRWKSLHSIENGGFRHVVRVGHCDPLKR